MAGVLGAKLSDDLEGRSPLEQDPSYGVTDIWGESKVKQGRMTKSTASFLLLEE